MTFGAKVWLNAAQDQVSVHNGNIASGPKQTHCIRADSARNSRLPSRQRLTQPLPRIKT